MWPDNETVNDLIGFQVHADLVREVVTDPKMLPVTVGVFGDWGGGKTSIMKMLERDLQADRWPKDSPEETACEGVAVIYLNTWLFEGYDDAKAALLSSVLLQLGEHKRFGPVVRDNVVALLKSVNVMRLARFGLKHVALPAAAAFATGGASLIPTAVLTSLGLASLTQPAKGDVENTDTAQGSEQVDWAALLNQNTSPAEPLDVRTFRQRFGKMLADSDIRALIVLIDDLDRCTPDRIIDSLEAIKLFLSVEHTAFVIGADPRIVQHAIRSRYAERASEGNEEESTRLVKDYLEKVIQVPYRLPRLSASEIETYMALLFCQRYLAPDDATCCVRACAEQRSQNRYSSFGYAAVKVALQRADLDPDLTAALTFSAAAAPLIADGLKGNPRQVKRFLNALLLRKQLARVAQLRNIRDDVLVKLMILEYAHEELFIQLFGWQAAQHGHPKQLADLEAALAGAQGNVNDDDTAKKVDPKWATTAVRKWVAMEPLLAGVDLRDYFWIARDRLESTFAGLSMVSPVVRTVLDDLLSGSPAKRNAATQTAKSLGEDERESLLGLIDQRLLRQPDDKTGYDALRALVETPVAGAAELFGKILETRPAEAIPAGVGMDLVTLAATKPALKALLDPAIQRLAKSSSRAGAAVKNALEAKR